METKDVVISKVVSERRRLYASAIRFMGSRVFFESESAASRFSPWLRGHGLMPFDDAAGAPIPGPSESVLDIVVEEER